MQKSSWKTICLRVFLTLACVATLWFIFSNSYASADKSSASSSRVTDAVQSVAKVFAPGSFIATAVGEDYKILMAWVRTFAHFAEFALLGALLIWCYFSYTKAGVGLVIPFLLIGYVPLVDECIQLFSAGRAGEVTDAVIDTLGGISGAGFAFLVLGIIALIRAVRKRRRSKA